LNRRFFFLTVGLLTCFTAAASCADPVMRGCNPGGWPNLVPRNGCPDNYCRKPLPKLDWTLGPQVCDDYCPKPLPAVPRPPLVLGCDEYCRKPLPKALAPRWFGCSECSTPSTRSSPAFNR
jgi:hypothetical protein